MILSHQLIDDGKAFSSCISYLLLCNKVSLKLMLKTADIYYLMVSVVRNLGVVLLCSSVSRLQLGWWPVLQAAQGWDGGKPASKFTHMPVGRPRPGPHGYCRESTSLPVGFSVKTASIRQKSQPFCNLISEVTLLWASLMAQQ